MLNNKNIQQPQDKNLNKNPDSGYANRAPTAKPGEYTVPDPNLTARDKWADEGGRGRIDSGVATDHKMDQINPEFERQSAIPDQSEQFSKPTKRPVARNP